ncbi:MAG: glycosyltransferase family 2 protein [Fibromonadaceae bacterium]|jgi:glycosyltransferase involved in cell wall biosynthesis|nr:glycosyltransferase family 2 protein [Fibromonadaceae bacterium]
MLNVKISVIVPVYNVEPYLRRCLDSLINQTLKDIEIICINDGSPDNSLAIIKRYAKRDERVKIIDLKENRGVSVARNSGMKIAKGEYIGFCDPDDYVDLDFYEKLYKLAKNKNADIAKGNVKITEINADTEFVMSINEQIRKHKGYFVWQYWTAIYRNKMLKKHRIKFPVGLITCQDMCFLVHAVIATQDVYLVNNVYYHYARRNNSSDSVIYSSEKMSSFFNCISLILNRLNKVAERDKSYIYMYALWFEFLFWFLSKNSEKWAIEKTAKIAIEYYHKHKFPKKLNWPKPVIAALKNKNEEEFAWFSKNWMNWFKLINKDYYPFIDIKEPALQNRKLYVWGTGEDGIRVKKHCEGYGWKITGFLDSNKSIRKYKGYKVERPERILNRPEKDFFIIISSRKYAREIAKICREAGLKMGRDFWRPD